MSRDFEKNVKSLFIAQENATINKEINLYGKAHQAFACWLINF